MDEKTKELICIGASVAAHCQPCLSYHFKKGQEAELTHEEIRQAIEFGEMVGKGAENAMKQYYTILLNENSK